MIMIVSAPVVEVIIAILQNLSDIKCLFIFNSYSKMHANIYCQRVEFVKIP